LQYDVLYEKNLYLVEITEEEEDRAYYDEV